MRTARVGGAELLPSAVLLTAIAEHGPRWPSVLAPDHEQYVIDRAIDREHMAGNLLDAITLSPRGRAVLTGEAIGADLDNYGLGRARADSPSGGSQASNAGLAR